ncbi:hypothetical protein [Reichenbachiella ulvae]|uniref:Right handed beta helix domain-containing protein n=1 Tax=Reichenbachiella ulvae TaxID=2980104 RepID=A0ABT3CXU7_9BACT|nr:hypothetical protein [Reichenbachiella ulvae]MCV9388424.1 hypothetical protein [Reichenbachiella ulvae]
MNSLKISLFLILSIVVIRSQAQNVLIADNNHNAPTGDFVFPNIQEAVDAAEDGDIIQVQPSPVTYGGATINKQITLMGIGFNVDKDIPLMSKMGNIVLTNNADNTSDADGTIIKGLWIANIYIGSNTGAEYLLEDILIENCQFNFIESYQTATYSPIDGLEIIGCQITGQAPNGYSIRIVEHLTNAIFRNNIIYLGIGLFNGTPGSNIIANNIMYEGIYINAEGSNTTIINNNFIASMGGDAAFVTELQDCIVANNIFYGMTPSIANGGNSTSGEFERNVFTNNLVYSTGDDVMPPAGGGAGNSGSGNISGIDPEFVNSQLLDTWSEDYDFTPQAAEVLNGGSDGTDIGITGGSYPIADVNFFLKTSEVPVIQILNTSTVINPGDDLPVHIKVKSN